MYCPPKGKISDLYYPELDIFFLPKIYKVEEIAFDLYKNIEKDKRTQLIRNFTLNKLWPEYCDKQEKCAKEYHANKKKTLGINLKKTRILLKLLLQDVSNDLQISIEQLEAWENGILMPDILEIAKLSQYYKHPFDTYIKNSYYSTITPPLPISAKP